MAECAMAFIMYGTNAGEYHMMGEGTTAQQRQQIAQLIVDTAGRNVHPAPIMDLARDTPRSTWLTYCWEPLTEDEIKIARQDIHFKSMSKK